MPRLAALGIGRIHGTLNMVWVAKCPECGGEMVVTHFSSPSLKETVWRCTNCSFCGRVFKKEVLP